MRSTALITLLVTLLTACASPRVLTESRVPLRAGVVPLVAGAPTAELAVDDGDPTELRLDLADRELSALLIERLDAECFTDAVLLDLGGLGPSDDGYDRAVREAAAAQGVDVVVWPTLRYSSTVHTAANEKLWLNLPLFLLGGPLNWIPNDRSYFVTARIEIEVLDPRWARSEDSVRDARAMLTRQEARADEVELDLFDRAGSGIGHYVLGVFVPGVFLAKETDQAALSLSDGVIEELLSDTVSELRDESTVLVEGRHIASFYPNLTLAAAGEGYALEGTVVLFDDVESGLREVRFEPAGLHPAIDLESAEGKRWGNAPDERLIYTIPPIAVDEATARGGVRVTIVEPLGGSRSFTYSVE